MSRVHQICIYIFEIFILDKVPFMAFYLQRSYESISIHYAAHQFCIMPSDKTIHCISTLIYRLKIYYANLGTGFVIGSSLTVAKIQMDMVHINIKWVNLILQGNTLKPASLKLQMVQMERMKSKSKDNPTENWKFSFRI